jgi:uncharacterized caspase-like protein
MSSQKRKAAIAIGVSDAQQLPYLAGALNGAKAFEKWAAALGYETRLVTDETGDVTIDRLRNELEQLLTAAPETHRFLLYFAGHGLIRGAEEALWLLSDWRNDLSAVSVEILRRRLLRFRVRQIGIFADACRSLPPDIEAADLTADGVLGLGPGDRAADVALDRLPPHKTARKRSRSPAMSRRTTAASLPVCSSRGSGARRRRRAHRCSVER